MNFKGTEYYSDKTLRIMQELEKDDNKIKLKKFKKFDKEEINLKKGGK